MWRTKRIRGTLIDAVSIARSPADLYREWQGLGPSLAGAGTVRFTREPANRGTVVSVRLRVPPSMASEVREKLRRFKQIMEAGEVPTTEGQPRGRR